MSAGTGWEVVEIEEVAFGDERGRWGGGDDNGGSVDGGCSGGGAGCANGDGSDGDRGRGAALSKNTKASCDG